MKLITSYAEEVVTSESIYVASVVRCYSIQVHTTALFSLNMVVSGLTPKVRAPHEVITGLFWIFAMDFSCHRVKLGELMSMEAVIMAHVTEGSCAVGHAFEFLLVNLLGVHVKVVDLITFEKDHSVVRTVWLGTLHCSIQMIRDSRENRRDKFGIVLLQLVLEIAEDHVVQEKELVVVVVWAVLRVHAERSIHMSQMMMVVQFREGFIGQLSLAMETLEQVVTLEEIRNSLLVHGDCIKLYSFTAVKLSTVVQLMLVSFTTRFAFMRMILFMLRWSSKAQRESQTQRKRLNEPHGQQVLW